MYDTGIYQDWIRGCNTGATWEICSKPTGNTVDGLCDMAGNVAEWAADTWSPHYNSDVPNDGSAWQGCWNNEDLFCEYRMFRGGSFEEPDLALQVFWRYNDGFPNFTADEYQHDLGFRCVRPHK